MPSVHTINFMYNNLIRSDYGRYMQIASISFVVLHSITHIWLHIMVIDERRANDNYAHKVVCIEPR